MFDQKLLDKRLTEDDDAVSNEYLNTGYLFFNLNPVEVKVENDSIDYEMRIVEGSQATINSIGIKGNTKTNEHVARRELYTRPGQLFSKENIIRSVRELSQMGHFNPEAIKPDVVPHPEDGTVDINYELEERANDQVELSGGWGGGMFVGTIGLKFSNFSVRNIGNKKAWRPLPTGDGQTLTLRAQTNGSYYQSYSFSFTEPWLGGKKPNSFTFSIYYSKQTSETAPITMEPGAMAVMVGMADTAAAMAADTVVAMAAVTAVTIRTIIKLPSKWVYWEPPWDWGID